MWPASGQGQLRAVQEGLRLLDDETCLLRLKRWLYAGLSDEGFPVQAQRRHHVGLGGPHLQQFADGPDEAETATIFRYKQRASRPHYRPGKNSRALPRGGYPTLV